MIKEITFKAHNGYYREYKENEDEIKMQWITPVTLNIVYNNSLNAQILANISFYKKEVILEITHKHFIALDRKKQIEINEELLMTIKHLNANAEDLILKEFRKYRNME